MMGALPRIDGKRPNPVRRAAGLRFGPRFLKFLALRCIAAGRVPAILQIRVFRKDLSPVHACVGYFYRSSEQATVRLASFLLFAFQGDAFI